MASIKRRTDGAWRARYRDEAGKEHARHFRLRIDAQRWLDEVTASVVTDSYVDPKAGAITFADYFADWSARQVWAPGTVAAMALAAGSVPFADLPMRAVRPSHLEAWIKTMTVAELAPGTIRTRFNNVRSVFRGARRDKVIGGRPLRSDHPAPSPAPGGGNADTDPGGGREDHGGGQTVVRPPNRAVRVRRVAARGSRRCAAR